MTANVVRITAHPGQLRFIQSRAREVLASGGYGSGKSLGLCLKLAMRAAVPGAVELLARKWNANLSRSTLRTLLEGDGETPPILPAGTYAHNMGRQSIALNGGGTILYVGCDEPQKLGSINATGAAVDEAAELTAADTLMIRSRVRSKVAGLSGQIYMATNPAGPTHHLAVRFGLDGQSAPAPGTEAITMRTSDNPNLPAEYVDDLSRLTGADRARFFDGCWVKAEGLVFPQFDRNTMVMRRPGPWSRIVVGQDAGFNDPDALLVVCIDDAGRIHVADEWCESGQLVDAVIERAHDFRARYGVTTFAVDPSAARLRETMAQAGLYVVKAANAILDGIRAVQRFMVSDAGGPRFTVDPSCAHLLRELDSYSWHPTRPDVPVDKGNHCVDALRYAVMELDDASRNTLDVRLIDPSKGQPDHTDTMRALLLGDHWQ